MEIKNVGIEEIRGCIYERQYTNTEQYRELVNSVKQSGVIEPICVREREGEGNGYEIIAGWQRFLACKEVGLREVEVRDFGEVAKTDALLISLQENVVGVEINAMDVAHQLNAIKEATNWNETTIAIKCGKTGGWISRHLSLIKQHDTIKEGVAKGEITEGQVRELKKVKDSDKEKVVKQVKGKTVKDTKNIVREYTKRNNQKTDIEKIKEEVEELNNKISEAERNEKKISDLTGKIEEKEGKIKEVERNIPKDLNGLVKKRREIEEKYFPTMEEISQLESEITMLESETQSFNGEEKEREEKRLQNEDEKTTEKIKKIRQELEELRNEIIPVRNKIKEVRAEIKEHENKIAVISEKKIRKTRLQQRADTLYARYELSINDFEGLKTDTVRGESANEKIKQLTHEMIELKNEKRKLQAYGNNKASWLQKRDELNAKLQGKEEGEKEET